MVPGLIDAENQTGLVREMERLKTKWSSAHSQGVCFVGYFQKYKVDAIRQTMTTDIRSMAGLGWPPGVYDQNGNECMNSVLQCEKQVTGKTKLPIPEFVRLLQTTAKRQRTDEDLALTGIRELRMDDKYTDCGVKESVFYRKSKAQQDAALTKFHELDVHVNKSVPIDLVEVNQDNMLPPLSMPIENSLIIGVPFGI